MKGKQGNGRQFNCGGYVYIETLLRPLQFNTDCIFIVRRTLKLPAPVLLGAACCAIVAMGSECKGTHLVAAGFCCFDVPCDYEVVQTSSWRDAWLGYIEPPDRS